MIFLIKKELRIARVRGRIRVSIFVRTPTPRVILKTLIVRIRHTDRHRQTDPISPPPLTLVF